MEQLGTKWLTVAHGGELCKLLLVEGAEPAALAAALVARLRLGRSPFYLTLPEGDAVVPLTASLPQGLTLSLHVDSDLRPRTRSRRFSDPVVEEVPLEAPGRQASSSEAPCGPESLSAPLLDDPREACRNVPPEGRGLPDAGVGEREPAGPRRRARSASDHSEIVSEVEEVKEDVKDIARNLDRFSRLGTDLSNERTLLAWTRTSLATLRTATDYIGIEASGAMWTQASFTVSHLTVLGIMVFAMIAGVVRYRRIKEITFMVVPPLQFGRMSMAWFYWLIIICVMCAAFGLLVPPGWGSGSV